MTFAEYAIELGNNVKRIRKEKDMNQVELGKMIYPERDEKSLQATMSKIENGKSAKSGVNLETLILISDALGVSIDTLLGRDKEQKKKKYLNSREVCELLAEIYEQFPFEMKVADQTVIEWFSEGSDSLHHIEGSELFNVEESAWHESTLNSYGDPYKEVVIRFPMGIWGYGDNATWGYYHINSFLNGILDFQATFKRLYNTVDSDKGRATRQGLIDAILKNVRLDPSFREILDKERADFEEW